MGKEIQSKFSSRARVFLSAVALSAIMGGSGEGQSRSSREIPPLSPSHSSAEVPLSNSPLETDIILNSPSGRIFSEIPRVVPMIRSSVASEGDTQAPTVTQREASIAATSCEEMPYNPQETGEIKEPFIYTVEEGDNLTRISQSFNNIPIEIIYNMNRETIGDNPDLIKPGQELLIVQWGPIEASHYLASEKMQEALDKGESIDWAYWTLSKELTVGEIANFFGIEEEAIIGLNEIAEPQDKLPQGYYLMIPAGEGFSFTETDREAGRRWQPRGGISLDAIWWEDATGQRTTEWQYPNKAFIMEPFPSETWIEESWSTADELPGDDFVPEEITSIPANRVWQIVDEKGNSREEERSGFLVYGKHRIIHTAYRKVEAGTWLLKE